MSVETAAEATVITRGWNTYQRVVRSEWRANGDVITAALEDLRLALETYRDLLTRRTDPSDAYFDLEAGDDALGQALSMTAQDVAGWSDELDWLVPESSNEGEEHNAAA